MPQTAVEPAEKLGLSVSVDRTTTKTDADGSTDTYRHTSVDFTEDDLNNPAELVGKIRGAITKLRAGKHFTGENWRSREVVAEDKARADELAKERAINPLAGTGWEE